MNKSLVLLEFNEICPELLDTFIAAGELPNFERLRSQADTYVTDAEEQPPNLEPWIQWVTVHTGMRYAEHGLFNLDEGHNLKNEQLWSHASKAGKKVWVCGSMNIGYEGEINGYVVPDPWTRETAAYPSGEFDNYVNFIQSQVQEHTNAKAKPKLGDAFGFLRFLMTRGMSFKLATQITSQIIKEVATGKFRWKRASILDLIQWHVFKWYFRKHRPEFSTLFLNSVAHFQHVYWRNMNPDIFEAKPDSKEQEELKDAILSGYKVFDRIIGECMEMAGDNTNIALLSALSQQPCLKYEALGGKISYRPSNFPEIMALANITVPYECSPVMTEEYLLRFSSEQIATESMAKLFHLYTGDDRVMKVRQEGQELMVGCTIRHGIDDDALVENRETGKGGVRFYDMFYKIKEKKSGEHNPDGVFWFWNKSVEGKKHEGKLPLVQVAPRLMKELGVPFGSEAAGAADKSGESKDVA